MVKGFAPGLLKVKTSLIPWHGFVTSIKQNYFFN